MAALMVGWMVKALVPLMPAAAGDEAASTRLSAALGEAKALYALQQFARAREAFVALAKAGQPEAAFRLALMLEAGQGGPPDPEAALHWLLKAAAAGYEPACRELASRRSVAPAGLSCGRRMADGDVLLHEAEAGDVRAMLLLARAKAAARDGQPDLEGAVIWLRRAAARGDRRVKAYVRKAIGRICDQPAAPPICRKAALSPSDVRTPGGTAPGAGR